jgi:hypothetical protein
MTRLKLRTFGIALILVSSTLGMSLTFSEGVLSGTDQEFNESDEINQLRSNFGNESQQIQDKRSQAGDVSIQTDFFFLKEIWNIIETVVGGLGSVINLVGNAESITGLNIPGSVLSLVGVVVTGVIFAVVAAARGWDV